MKQKGILSFLLCIAMFTSLSSTCFADDSIAETIIESAIATFVDTADAGTMVAESKAEPDKNDSTCEETVIGTNDDVEETVNIVDEMDAVEAVYGLDDVVADAKDDVDAVQNSDDAVSASDDDVSEKTETSEAVKSVGETAEPIISAQTADKIAVEGDSATEEKAEGDAVKKVEEEINKELDVELLLMDTSVSGSVYNLRDQVYFGVVRYYVYSSCITADIVDCYRDNYVEVDIDIKDTELSYIKFDLCYDSDFIIFDEYNIGDVEFDEISLIENDGVLSVFASSDENVNADGTMLRLYFYVPAKCPLGAFELEFDNTVARNMIYGKMNLYYFNGAIYVLSDQYQKVSEPIASVVSGTVIKGTKVALSTYTPDATIYYTTNSQTPTVFSKKYTQPIVIDKNMVIKAIAVKDGFIDSEISEFRYSILDDYAPVIKVENAKGSAGNTVEVTLSLDNNPGIISMRLYVDYDDSIFTLTGVKDMGILGNQTHSNNYSSPYSLYWNNGTATQNYVVNGNIVTLSFKIKKDAQEGIYPIELSYNGVRDDILDVDLEPVWFEIVNGSITVTNTLYGDVNDDGVISAKDNAFLARHLANWIGYEISEINAKAADVNNDGYITAKDNAILSRNLANWTGYEILPYLK